MAQERGDSSASVGGTSSDTPSTFEQSTLKGTTQTGNARLIVRDATQIDVIDTNNVWSTTTVEGVLDEIAGLAGLDSGIQDQIDVINGRLTINEADIDTNTAAITAEETARINADALKVDLAGDTMDSAANLTFAGGGEVLGLPGTPSATGASSKEYTDTVGAAASDDGLAFSIAFGG